MQLERRGEEREEGRVTEEDMDLGDVHHKIVPIWPQIGREKVGKQASETLACTSHQSSPVQWPVAIVSLTCAGQAINANPKILDWQNVFPGPPSILVGGCSIERQGHGAEVRMMDGGYGMACDHQ